MNLKINNINDFSKFMKIYRLDVGISPKDMKSLVRTYLKNYLIAQIKEMVVQDFTLPMMFKSITQNDKTLASHLNINTFKSWVRKNIHKDALKAQAQLLAMKAESNKTGSDQQRHNVGETNVIVNSGESVRKKELDTPCNESLSHVSYAKVSCYKNKASKNKNASLLIPKPKLPLREMTPDECIDYFGNQFYNIKVDSNNFIFDGYSSEDESSLVPIPSGYEILPEQDGLNMHFFTFEKATISSKKLRTFLETRIANGFTNLVFLTLNEDI